MPTDGKPMKPTRASPVARTSKPSPVDALAVELCTRAGHDPYSVVQVVAMRWREEWREIHNQTCGPLWELYRDKALWLRRRLAGDFHT